MAARSLRLRSHWVVVWMLLPFLCGAAAPYVTDLSTPENTVETYYRGYRLGDRSLIAKTFLSLEASSIEKVGLGDDIEYRIERKLQVLYARLAGREGDIEIVTYAKWSSPQGADELRTTFLLRNVKGEWKIVEFFSSSNTGCSPN